MLYLISYPLPPRGVDRVGHKHVMKHPFIYFIFPDVVVCFEMRWFYYGAGGANRVRDFSSPRASTRVPMHSK